MFYILLWFYLWVYGTLNKISNINIRNYSRISGLMFRSEKCLFLHKLNRCNTFHSLFTETVFNIMLKRWNRTNDCSESVRFDVISYYISTNTEANVLRQWDMYLVDTHSKSGTECQMYSLKSSWFYAVTSG